MIWGAHEPILMQAALHTYSHRGEKPQAAALGTWSLGCKLTTKLLFKTFTGRKSAHHKEAAIHPDL